MVIKYGDFWVVCRNISVEFLLVEIPLYTVEVVTLKVVVTLENGLMAFQSMWRNDGIRKKLDTGTTWK
jgi:hypothetical protein